MIDSKLAKRLFTEHSKELQNSYWEVPQISTTVAGAGSKPRGLEKFKKMYEALHKENEVVFKETIKWLLDIDYDYIREENWEKRQERIKRQMKSEQELAIEESAKRTRAKIEALYDKFQKRKPSLTSPQNLS